MNRYKRYERKRVIFMQDVVMCLLASLLAILLVRWVTEPIANFTQQVVGYLLISLVGICIGELIFRPYLDVRRFTTVRSMGKALLAVLAKELLLTAVFFLVGIPRLSTALIALALLADTMFSCFLMVYVRFSARLMMTPRKDVKSQAQRLTALVSGTDTPSLLLAEELENKGYAVVGFVTTDVNMSGRVIADFVVYHCANPEQLARLQWQLGGVDAVFFPKQNPDLMSGADGEDSIPQQDGMSFLGHVLKRGFDIGLSSILLLIFSPVIGLCAWAVKREDGGPVFYAQERIGKNGKPFFIYKFRSMRVDAEKEGSPALYSGEEDPRLTRVGRFLRAHHLDELPQLWNVLRGDMSFIGYRPERQYYIDKIMACNARYRYLYQIRPGVTSYATLYNGYTDTLEKMLTRLDLDLYYLRNHSVWFDLKVLGLTFLSIVSGKKF